eukprot:CAMPEP_0170536952 /NCGR_PEP_ID=MMETSP0209-20121228/102436_1 /TAXON_ID=665100 ORGANISM="Litonotus pictus, Strain P1" /NCGR_SAMPLE_ID=MMETSP0209 /ASSEMBLY_ACC=CAM_ASM_000301 /LENGTH=296 /DNA_ID=CAMNT_0010838379 /DNA_START=1054 /DNA_END=1944 /DNA_ORIENTATION=+
MSYYCSFSKGKVFDPEAQEFKSLAFPPPIESAVIQKNKSESCVKERRESTQKGSEVLRSERRPPFQEISQGSSHEGLFLYYREASQESLKATIKYFKARNTKLNSIIYASYLIALSSMTEDPVTQKSLSITIPCSLRGNLTGNYFLGLYIELLPFPNQKIDHKLTFIDLANSLEKQIKEKKKAKSPSDSDPNAPSMVFDAFISNIGKYPFPITFETADSTVKLINHVGVTSVVSDPFCMYFISIRGWTMSMYGFKDDKSKEVIREVLDRAYNIMINSEAYADKSVEELYSIIAEVK